jgi:hypothetical protein
MIAEILGQGVAQNILEGTVRLAGLIILPPTCGPTEIEPVGRPVAGTLKTLRIDKSFKIIEGMMIESLPILGQDLYHLSQDAGSQAGNPNPGQDEKPGVAGDQR